MAAVPWLAVPITACTLFADLDFPGSEGAPGPGEAGNPPPGIPPSTDSGNTDPGPSPEDAGNTVDAGDAGKGNDASPPGRNDAGGGTGSNYAAAVMADGPGAYWRLGDRSGTTAKDSAGTNNGVYEQGFALGVAGAMTNDTAVRFDGQRGTRIRVADVFDFSNNASCTFEAWVKWEGRDSGCIFSKRADDNNGTGYSLSVASVDGGRVQWTYLRQDGTTREDVKHTAPAPTGFVHIVATYNGSVGRLYLNGSEVANASFNNTRVGGVSTLFLGNSIRDDGAFQGTLDELAIYERVLPADRIRAHYIAGTTK